MLELLAFSYDRYSVQSTPLFSSFESVICDRFLFCRAESITVAFFYANEPGTDNAVLAAVEEDKRSGRSGFRFEVRIVRQLLKFLCHRPRGYFKFFLKNSSVRSQASLAASAS